jgi:hypothetical protein
MASAMPLWAQSALLKTTAQLQMGYDECWYYGFTTHEV